MTLSQKKQAEYLAAQDPILGMLIARTKVPSIKKRGETHFEVLVAAIVGQQISLKAAASIRARVKEVCGGVITPETVLNAQEDALRSAGLSKAKVAYVRDLAERTHTGALDLCHVGTLSDREVYKELVAVRGIGPWTAEMFMMFALRREDIFSPGDLGLINAMITLYRLRKPVSKKRVERITAKWKPYRTLASRYLWASLEPGDGTWP